MFKKIKKTVKKIKLPDYFWSTFYWALFTFILIISGFILISTTKNGGGVKLFTVRSSSMSPYLKPGYIIFTKPQTSYRTGNVITFASHGTSNLITHRISGIEESEQNKNIYITKGDANEDADSQRVPADDVIGKVIFFVPLMGYFTSFAKTKMGTVVIVIIPATIFIFNEILNIKNQLVLLKKRNKS